MNTRQCAFTIKSLREKVSSCYVSISNIRTNGEVLHVYNVLLCYRWLVASLTFNRWEVVVEAAELEHCLSYGIVELRVTAQHELLVPWHGSIHA